MICLYYGHPEECQLCGGWTGADTFEPKPGEPLRGPSMMDDRFCSNECYWEAVDLGWVKV